MPIVLDKPPGWTPLEAIETLRAADPSLARARMGYAGRLDPLAEGVMLVLRDEENRASASFCALDKTYRVGVLFGLATDTFDALGLVEPATADVDISGVPDAARSFVGTFAQTVPAYASHRVNGKPLFHWARRGMADQVPRPAPLRTIRAIEHEGDTRIAPGALLASIEARVAEVRGDFRQAEIALRWRAVLGGITSSLQCAQLRVECSSGTFMRALAHDLGRALGTSALALTIERLRVGPHERIDARKFPAGTVRPPIGATRWRTARATLPPQ
ncbi:MAG: hypothetical protein WCJ30_07690 [Deltaproteobacteria bacterium]